MAPDHPLPKRVTPGRVTERVSDAVHDKGYEAAEHVRERVREVKAEVKPKLRGWLHASTVPLALAAGIVLIVLSPTLATRVGSAVFASSALLLFTVSAIYHRGTWTPRTSAMLRRFDHSNIFLLIAGSYTPFTLILLEGSARVWLLTIVWTGAILGVLFRIFWIDAPRWIYTPIYMALGWVAIFYAGDFSSGGTAVITLIAVGGGLYTLGGLVHGLKKPDPFPTWFGFHEVFHSLTIAAFICHYVAASIATYQLR
jgi:hemolysin III